MSTLQQRHAFIQQHRPYAEAVAQKLGVHPNDILSQIALETDYGVKVLSGTYNYGNVKEFRKGVAGRMAKDIGDGMSKFRIFNSADDFYNYYGNLLSNSRYRNAGVVGAKDITAFASALQRGGYATSPKYARTMVDVYNSIVGLDPNYKWNGQATYKIDPSKVSDPTLANLAGVGDASGGVGHAGNAITDAEGKEKQHVSALDETVKQTADSRMGKMPQAQTMGLDTLANLFKHKGSTPSWRS